ncbi:hypothetical protein [uncultured Parabacteroides sp.]|uniref:hypothetical protein n=1 Tax=uncultured Parabacteroides sp. TaxID=512312 RepID=UPI00263A8D1F|nr:hypothetical protein [uncultured Parabacteroides sp.]
MADEKIGNIFVYKDDDGKAVWEFEGKIQSDIPLDTEAQDFAGAINELAGHPAKAIYNNSDDILILKPNTDNNSQDRQFKFTVTGKGTSEEKVTAMIFPDGTSMSLEGF